MTVTSHFREPVAILDALPYLQTACRTCAALTFPHSLFIFRQSAALDEGQGTLLGIERDTRQAMGSSVGEQLVSVLGTVGGVFLTGAILPQIYQVHKTRSSKDLSYVFQVSTASPYGSVGVGSCCC